MPFGADIPTPEFVGNSRLRGARSPPGTPRDLTTPWVGTPTRPATSPEQSGELCPPATSSRQSGEAPPGGLHQSKVRKSCARVDFSRAKSESVPPGNFRRAKSESVPGGGSGRRVGVPARAAKNRPLGEKKPGFFPAPTRMYKEARPPFSQKNR